MEPVASRTLVRILAVLAPLSAVVAVSTASPISAANDELRAAIPTTEIIGGELTEPGEFDGVVALQAGTGLCSGTVVAPRLILTAAHCLAALDPNTEVIVHYGDHINAGTIVASNWGAHPQFCPDCKQDLFDYGYVEIDTDFMVPGGYILPIATQAEWDQAMAEGREVTVVGYGEDPGTGDGVGVKRKVTTTISKLSKGGLEFYAGGNAHDSCNGDSGGPAFVRVGSGELRLAGITSRGSNPCGDGGYYGAPYPALCWVRNETGVDFIGGECANCDCIDTDPPGDDSDCAVDPHRDDAPWALLAFALLPVVRRLRSRRR
jgi:V8-like Glu-specific endopeptidase